MFNKNNSKRLVNSISSSQEDIHSISEIYGHNQEQGASTISTESTQPSTRKTSVKSAKKVFGPQNRELEKVQPVFTPIERRLSGMIKANRQHNNILTKKRANLLSAQSLPNLTLPSASNNRVDKSSSSPKNSGDSSGYKSEGGSPSHKCHSPARSHASDSDYGYATITELMKPKPLAQHRLGHMPANTSEIPKECFTTKEEKKLDDETGKQFFDKKYYISSITFMRSFADIFADKLADTLGFTGSLDSAMLQGSKIFCEVAQTGHDSKPIKIQNEIIPTIPSTEWTQEALKWKRRDRPQVLDKGTGKVFTWPRREMIEHVTRFGCHLIPQGFVPTRGINNDQYLEWQLAFPEAERCLEMYLSHSHIRCLLFCLSLYKTYLEPLNGALAFNPMHFRTLLFRECENKYHQWPEERAGETLKKFLSKMYDCLKDRHLSDYFIEGRNVFESTPGLHLSRVQERLKRVIENPVMHLLTALRNVRYVESSFYPVPDYKKLYNIITSDNLAAILNPNLKMPSKPKLKFREELFDKSDEEDNPNIDLRKRFNEKDLELRWNKKMRQKIEAERAEQKCSNPPSAKQRRPSTDSIDTEKLPEKGAEPLRRRLLLEFFISHFIDIAKKSNEFRATRQAFSYLKHAERLNTLLQEIPDIHDKPSIRFKTEINEIQLAIKSVPDWQQNGISTTKQYKRNITQPANNTFKPILNNQIITTVDVHKPCPQPSNPERNRVAPPILRHNQVKTKKILKTEPRPLIPEINVVVPETPHRDIDQVETEEIHKPDPRSSNPEITIVIPESLPRDTSINVDQVETEESTDF